MGTHYINWHPNFKKKQISYYKTPRHKTMLVIGNNTMGQQEFFFAVIHSIVLPITNVILTSR